MLTKKCKPASLLSARGARVREGQKSPLRHPFVSLFPRAATLIDEIVIGRLSVPDANIVLGGPVATTSARCTPRRPGYAPASTIWPRCSPPATSTDRNSSAAPPSCTPRLAIVDAQLAAARASSALAGLVLAGDDLRATWAATPDVRGKVIDALMTVTVLPGARGASPAVPTSTRP